MHALPASYTGTDVLHRHSSIYGFIILPMTAAAAVSLPALVWKNRPSPAEVDELVLEFSRLESKALEAYRVAEELERPREAFEERLVLLVEEWGSPHASKSKLLVGTSSEVLATFGSTRSIDAAAVEGFRIALQQAGRVRVIKKLFEECISWRLVDGADSIIRGEQLSDRLQAAYARCFTEKPRAPSLKVRLR
jgi:hypothetical protein